MVIRKGRIHEITIKAVIIVVEHFRFRIGNLPHSSEGDLLVFFLMGCGRIARGVVDFIAEVLIKSEGIGILDVAGLGGSGELARGIAFVSGGFGTSFIGDFGMEEHFVEVAVGLLGVSLLKIVFSFLLVKVDLSDGGIESVFDGIFRSSMKTLSHFGPAGAEFKITIVDDFIFISGPFTFLDVRLQAVVPSFSALLAGSALDNLRSLSPVVGTVGLDPLNELFVFFRSPGTLDNAWLDDLGPSVHTLEDGLAGKVGGDFRPVLLVVLGNEGLEDFIFMGSPFGFTSRSGLGKAGSLRV